MSDYAAPISDMRFVMHELAGLERVSSLPGYEEASPDLVDAILDEAGRFAGQVLSPLNPIGDREGAKWADGNVTKPKGFKEAYTAFAANGWVGIGCPAEFGGQGMPRLVTAAVKEIFNAANIAFSLCPLLSAGAIESLLLCGSEVLKETFLHKMVGGEWTGTMNLTEPQAGSDLAAIRTRAEPQPDGSFKIFGQKIFITYGEHDLADNIVHLVLARLPDAPPGVKGISLFVVPKFLVKEDGSLGARNDVHCVSIEHKLGIHASPTAVLAFGDHGGAAGYLVGEPNRGLEYMFVMMNDARFSVGVQGLAVADRAYQHALSYAKERVQGSDIAGGPATVTIIQHPDVRRMLMLMKSQIEAMRALAYVVGAAEDAASHDPDPAERKRNQVFVDLMIPIVKGWSTETGADVASLGIQVHGGVGFIEETGAAQYLRDTRITAIYEGTTGIQGNDLIGRKVARDGGAALKAVLGLMRSTESELAKPGGVEFNALREGLAAGIRAVSLSGEFVVARYADDVRTVAAGAVPFLKLMGIVCGGWQMARAALIAQGHLQAGRGDASFYRAKIATARFYADHVLAQSSGLAHTVIHGGAGVMTLQEAQF